MLSKRFFFFGAACLLASGALFAQDVAIEGKDFESGAADAKLAEIARQAVASGKTVVVTTPPYWQSKVAGKLRAAAPGVQMRAHDAFFENVLVRIVDADKSAKPEAVAAKPAAKAAEPAAVPKAAPRAETHVAAAAPAAEPARKAADVPARPPESSQASFARPAPAPEAPAAEVAAASAPAAGVPEHAAQVASISPPSSVAAPRSAPADVAAIKRGVENQFNQGRPASGAIGLAQLQKDDEIFLRGPVRAVVRRDRSHIQLFWIEGDLNLERAELVKTDADRYRVSAPLRNVSNPTLRAMHSAPEMFTAEVPGERSQVRHDMERHFNDAHPIADRMQPRDLRYGDLFYVFRKHAVVFRRTDLGFNRYWLEGEIDLNQSGVIKTGDAYRIVSERL